MLKIWVFGRSRFQVRLLDVAGQVVKLLADDVGYFQALDVVVRWKVRHRLPLVPVVFTGRYDVMSLRRAARSCCLPGAIPPSPR
jgi:hypothetical protein